MKSAKLSFLYGIAAALIPLVFVILYYLPTGALYQCYDDSAITFRYAINFANGHGLVFNIGERADAASAFLYTIILAGAYKTGLHDLEFVSYILNMISLSIISLFVYFSVAKLSRNRLVGLAIGVLASCHGFISGWAVMLMDTPFFVALTVLWAWSVIEKRIVAGTILTMLIVFSRFEGLILLPIWCVMAWRNKYHSITIVAPCLLAYLFNSFRVSYYDTLFPHAVLAKQILAYYQPNPVNILFIWLYLAFPLPVLAFAGTIKNKKLMWVGIYVVVSSLSCLIGPHADWARYTVHLLPLMLVLSAPLMKKRYIIISLIVILSVQVYYSARWMRYQSYRIGVANKIRVKCGDWLQQNADKSQWIVSGDIGMIAYRAIDCKFIDMIGVTSPDVLQAYQKGENADKIVQRKSPRYIANTFNVENGKLVSANSITTPLKNGKVTTTIPCEKFEFKAGSQYTEELAIIVAELKN